ncbi:MAG TPA: flagellar basal-body MS-ring/collar protein FliF [Candidatus Acidoferrum sp.]|nr:flagellar basal-body MS-ring/collar protein FliF [Candidatus Acidoferrum sp.]
MATSTITSTTSSALASLASLSQMSIMRQIGFLLLIAASIALGFSVVMWSRDEDYSVLYPEAAAQDNTDMVNALEGSQIAYRIDPKSGLVSVPSTQLQQTRLMLANQGLPRTAHPGYKGLDDASPIGASNFVEQTRYNRALEQELVTTIKLIRGVRDARVHLSIPKQTSFVRNGNKPSASVMVDLVGSQAISDSQIAGIAHLVSASVAGMEASDVSIVDQKGKLLSRQHDADFQSSAEQVQFTRELEQEYTQRILGILTPMVGEGKVKAQVTADLNFMVTETTEENYNPQGAVLRSEQTQQENRATSTTPLPGELAQNAPTQSNAANAANNPQGTQDNITNTTNAIGNQSRVNATRNYEIDRSVSHHKNVPGTINRLSVAVVVDLTPKPVVNPDDDKAKPAPELTPQQVQEKLAKFDRIVKETIGFSDKRGDSVNIISEAFTPDAALMESTPLPVWEQAWVWRLAKLLGAITLVLVLIFTVLRPAMTSVVRPSINVVSQAVPQLGSSINVQLAASEDVQNAQNGVAKLPARSVYDENLQLAQNLVKNEPARAARMIKEWVAND